MYEKLSRMRKSSTDAVPTYKNSLHRTQTHRLTSACRCTRRRTHDISQAHTQLQPERIGVRADTKHRAPFHCRRAQPGRAYRVLCAYARRDEAYLSLTHTKRILFDSGPLCSVCRVAASTPPASGSAPLVLAHARCTPHPHPRANVLPHVQSMLPHSSPHPSPFASVPAAPHSTARTCARAPLRRCWGGARRATLGASCTPQSMLCSRLMISWPEPCT